MTGISKRKTTTLLSMTDCHRQLVALFFLGSHAVKRASFRLSYRMISRRASERNVGLVDFKGGYYFFYYYVDYYYFRFGAELRCRVFTPRRCERHPDFGALRRAPVSSFVRQPFPFLWRLKRENSEPLTASNTDPRRKAALRMYRNSRSHRRLERGKVLSALKAFLGLPLPPCFSCNLAEPLEEIRRCAENGSKTSKAYHGRFPRPKGKTNVVTALSRGRFPFALITVGGGGGKGGGRIARFVFWLYPSV